MYKAFLRNWKLFHLLSKAFNSHSQLLSPFQVSCMLLSLYANLLVLCHKMLYQWFTEHIGTKVWWFQRGNQKLYIKEGKKERLIHFSSNKCTNLNLFEGGSIFLLFSNWTKNFASNNSVDTVFKWIIRRPLKERESNISITINYLKRVLILIVIHLS
jgi:hypothetical protein